MRRLNSEGKKTILGADMETQTPFLELEMAPKQTRPTNQEAHYLQSRCMLNRPNKNYHRSEKIVSLHPPRNCVKKSYLSYRTKTTEHCSMLTPQNMHRRERNQVTSSTGKYPIIIDWMLQAKGLSFWPQHKPYISTLQCKDLRRAAMGPRTYTLWETM